MVIGSTKYSQASLQRSPRWNHFYWRFKKGFHTKHPYLPPYIYTKDLHYASSKSQEEEEEGEEGNDV